MSLLEVSNLEVEFPANRGWIGRDREQLKAVAGVTFSIAAGETVGLVGESGCGKTTLGRAIVRLVEPSAGVVRFDGQDITRLRGKDLRSARRGFQLIFQDPYNSLDPRFTAGQSIAEALSIQRLASSADAGEEQVGDLLEAVGLARSHADSYPHELSGGQRQRIGIARALAVEPRLLVCDEPVSALDVSIQAQIVNLLGNLQQQRGLACLFISHDLAVVEHFCRRVLVMYLGRFVETGATELLLGHPRHPYTQALLSAVPTVDPEARRERILLPGEPPSPLHPPAGCPFHPRCPIAESRCRTTVPALRETTEGYSVACHLVD